MKFYDSVGPNPQVVRIFMAERGVEVPKVTVDLRGGENRQAAYLTKNTAGQTPCLELDDGSVIAEITVICEYLDDITPGLSLFGANAREKAEARMWLRRIDLNIVEPLANGFRFSQGLKLFQNRIRCIPQAADDLKLTAQERLTWLDRQMAGKTWICGDRFTICDIFLYCFLAFGAAVGQPMNPENANIAAWFERVKARPAAAA
jgi:glutathione S-transferase